MNDDQMPDTEARMDRIQHWFAVGAIIGSIALSLQHIVMVMHPRSWVAMAIMVISLAGWTLFFVSMFRGVKLSKTPEGMAYRLHAARDERVKSNRNQAFTVGFAAMLVMEALLIVAWVFFHDVDPGFLRVPITAPSVIAVGVTASLVRFQILSAR